MPLDTLAWKAVVGDLYDAQGRPVPPEIGRGVYRDDDGALLALCGPHFKPVQHQDVLDPILQTLKDQGYEIRERRFDRHDLLDLKGEKGAFVAVDDAKHGAVVKATVITGDFTQPTGPSIFLPDGPPTLFRRYEVLNSHDGSYAAQAVSSYLNLVCLNGLVNPMFSAVTKGKHTTGFSIDAFRKKVLVAAEMMESDTERFALYIRSRLTMEQAKLFLEKTLAALQPKPDGTPHWSEPLVNTILEAFRKEASKTVWGLYQAMTWWATHGDLRTGATPLTARVGRDERVARAMRAEEFKQLLAA